MACRLASRPATPRCRCCPRSCWCRGCCSCRLRTAAALVPWCRARRSCEHVWPAPSRAESGRQGGQWRRQRRRRRWRRRRRRRTGVRRTSEPCSREFRSPSMRLKGPAAVGRKAKPTQARPHKGFAQPRASAIKTCAPGRPQSKIARDTTSHCALQAHAAPIAAAANRPGTSPPVCFLSTPLVLLADSTSPITHTAYLPSLPHTPRRRHPTPGTRAARPPRRPTRPTAPPPAVRHS